MKNQLKEGGKLMLREFLKEEDGMGVIEIILIIVVLISLVVIFKGQISSLVTSILNKIKKNANAV